MKATYFVCSAISDGKLISETMEAKTSREAKRLFVQQFSYKPGTVVGPFFKKNQTIEEKIPTMQFSKVNKPAEYQDWKVNAFLLENPVDSAFIFFQSKKDGSSNPKPQSKIVPIEELKFIS